MTPGLTLGLPEQVEGPDVEEAGERQVKKEKQKGLLKTNKQQS